MGTRASQEVKTQKSQGQIKQEFLADIEELERTAQYVEWMDGYQIKSFIEELLKALKKGR